MLWGWGCGEYFNRKLIMCVGYIIMISCCAYLVTLTLMQEIDVRACVRACVSVCVCVLGGSVIR